MRGLDLFSGVGLFSLGMEEAGIETVAACEIADWKRLIFAELCGEMPMWNDIRDMRGDDVLERAGPIDIVFGSPPCTDASLANSNGKGISGAETGLFLEAIRVIREIRPHWIALENVPGLRTRGADGVLAELEQAGYAVWPIVVGADNAGAPHIRKRVWIVGYATQERPAKRQGPPTGRRRDETKNGQPARVSEGWRNARETDAESASKQMGRGGQPRQADAADADSPGIRQQPRRGSGQNGQGAAVIATEDGSHPDRQGQQRQPVDGEMAGQSGSSDAAHTNGQGQRGLSWGAQSQDTGLAEPHSHAGDTDEQRLAFWQSLAGDHGPQLAALERDIGPAIHEWAGGLGSYLRVADGCPAKTARMLMSACGDGVVVSVAQAIGRAIIATDRGLTC